MYVYIYIRRCLFSLAVWYIHIYHIIYTHTYVHVCRFVKCVTTAIATSSSLSCHTNSLIWLSDQLVEPVISISTCLRPCHLLHTILSVSPYSCSLYTFQPTLAWHLDERRSLYAAHTDRSRHEYVLVMSHVSKCMWHGTQRTTGHPVKRHVLRERRKYIVGVWIQKQKWKAQRRALTCTQHSHAHSHCQQYSHSKTENHR